MVRMKSIALKSRSFSPALKGPVLLLLLVAFSAPVLRAQAHSDQQRSDRLITHPGLVKSLPSQNKRWALLIGVDRYEDSNIGALKGAANDANSLRDVLVNYAGFPADQVVVLSTSEAPERQPTRKNILKRLSNLSGLVPKDGLLLVSFAGHGIERSGQAFLIPSDATLTEDIGLLEETAVAVGQMKRRIKETGVQQVMILLDACRAYPTGRSDSSNPLTPAFVNAFSFENRNREIEAFVVLYATAPGFRAYEYSEKHQGYFSWGIAQALKGAAANDRGEVTLGALVKYLEDTVPKLVALDYGSKVIQKPFAEIGGYRADELVLAIASRDTRISRPTSNPDDASKNARVETDRPQQTQLTPTKRRGAKSGNVIILFSSYRVTAGGFTDNHAISDEFIGPLAAALSKRSLNVTGQWAYSREADKILRNLGSKSAIYALVIKGTFSLSDLAPYNGLDVSEANGSLELIDSDSGRVIARENLSRVRGFGNSQDQARRNALKNAADGVSESFMKQVVSNAN
jgi:uncharacterized caspase-like protein